MKLLLQEVWKRDRRSFLTILVWNIGISILGGIGIVMLIPLLNMLQIGDSRLPGWFIALPYSLRVGLLLTSYVLLVTVKALLSRSLAIRETHFLEETGLQIRERLYQSVSGASWESLTAQKDSDLINLFTSQCGQVSYGIGDVIHLLASLVNAGIQLGIALMMSAPVTVLACVLGVFMLTVFSPLRKKSREYGDEMIRISREFYGELYNQLASVKEVRAYGVEQEHAELFDRISTSFKTARMRYVRQSSVPGVLYSVAAALLVAGIYLVSSLGLRVEIDRLVVLVYVFARLWPIFSSFQGRIQGINSYVPAVEKVNEALSKLQPENEAPDTEADFSEWQKAAFCDVHFAYQDSDGETLQGVSFAVKRGETLALLGRNGAGKTTAVNLLLGFLLPNSGTIQVDGEVLTAANIRVWRRQAGYVPQDPLILNASVRENLTRFHPAATEDELIAALKAAMAWTFVSNLSQGLDTPLGDRGIRLSGGERQRLVLARVLLGQPSLIVLDEATSALDYESETAFQQVIQNMRGSAAVVLIAHRLSTVRMADRAVVLEDGLVVEQGTFLELTRKKDGYLAGMLEVT
ncbi:MAG: ABC transporter ATP-binding protein [Bacillota bacterium]|nr:ABC transporter ATP-binding protein [Bacillota bacterium]